MEIRLCLPGLFMNDIELLIILLLFNALEDDKLSLFISL